MSEQALQRHEILFSMSSDSMARVQALLQRCGHANMNLLLARGLSLVEWVMDQADQGRTVGAVVYGEQAMVELRERKELLKPGSAAKALSAGTDPATAPEDVQPAAPNPKLVARDRVEPEHEPLIGDQLPRARRLFKHAAFAVNDDAGPVRSLAFHQERCDAMGLEPPVSFNGHAMPGDLTQSHLEELQQVMEAESMATHFLLCPVQEQMSFYGYFPKTGWHRLSRSTGQWTLDPQVQDGTISLFPMDLAAAFLRRQRRAPEIESLVA